MDSENINNEEQRVDDHKYALGVNNCDDLVEPVIYIPLYIHQKTVHSRPLPRFTLLSERRRTHLDTGKSCCVAWQPLHRNEAPLEIRHLSEDILFRQFEMKLKSTGTVEYQPRLLAN
jgi:hypothetical protein